MTYSLAVDISLIVYPGIIFASEIQIDSDGNTSAEPSPGSVRFIGTLKASPNVSILLSGALLLIILPKKLEVKVRLLQQL